MTRETTTALERRDELRADCSNCFALCCVALAFAKSADFAFDKSAGDPCDNLSEGDFGCTIHGELRPRGFKGCTVFDCFGAGQKVSQQEFDGISWRVDPGSRASMFAVFPIVRQLQELLWFVNEARLAAGDDGGELSRAYDEIDALSVKPAAELLALDVDAIRESARPLLLRASGAARVRHAASRGSAGLPKKVAPGADLLGADLAGQDLRGADLRGSYLIAADLTGADLRGVDLLGADLRDTDLSAADVREALFLTQVQLNSALGDASTRIPDGQSRPAHWSNAAR